MTSGARIATIFGGTGFIGRYVVRLLARQGYTVKVATRVPERAFFLRPCGVVGQVVPFACDYNDSESISAAVRGADVVVNCVGILFEKKRSRFQVIHVDVPRMIAAACAAEKVDRLVHISALSVDKAGSRYAQSKREGDTEVLKHFPAATILRPSVVFGPEDGFFNMFAGFARLVPILPLIGGGHTKFQPVYVGDVADAVMAALALPASGLADPRGKISELGGPEVVTFREIYERLFFHTGLRRMTMTLPWGIAKIQAAFMSLMPRPLLTPDQVESLKTDNVVRDGALAMAALGLTPAGMRLVLPRYLERYRPGGRFADKKQA